MDSSREEQTNTGSSSTAISTSAQELKANNTTGLIAEDEEHETIENQNEGMELSSSSSSSAYEGVKASDFTEFKGELMPMVQGSAACMFVLVWAVMFCAGMLAVRTLIKSLER